MLELLVVLTLVSVVAMIAAPTYISMQKNVALSNQTQEVLNALRLVQQRSIISRSNISHGVKFNSTDIVLFGGDYATPDYAVIVPLKNGLEVIEGETAEVKFERLTGESVDQEIKIGYPGGVSKTIAISSSGTVSLP